MFTAVSLFLKYLPIVFVCSCLKHIVVNIIEFYATVIEDRGLASYKTRFNPPFSNASTMLGI